MQFSVIKNLLLTYFGWERGGRGRVRARVDALGAGFSTQQLRLRSLTLISVSIFPKQFV